MNANVVAGPFVIEDFLQFCYQRLSILLDLRGRQYPVVDFAHICGQLPLFLLGELALDLLWVDLFDTTGA